MHKSGKLDIFLAFGLTIAFVLAIFCGNIVNGQADPFDIIEEKLNGISEEEKGILQDLFALAQEIESMERTEKELGQEIEAINGEINSLEAAIEVEAAAYAKKQEGLKQVLKSYQRLGPGSYLEILLDSDSLTTFLRRLNTLRDLTRDTGELLEQLEANGEKLSVQKSKLSEKLKLVEQKKQQSKAALDKKLKLKENEESYLAALKGEREFYQEYLSDIQQMWGELKPIFRQAASEFSDIIEEGNLPQDALKVTFSFFNAEGTIDEIVFNEVISEQSDLPKMIFDFQPGKIEISLPEQKLVLTGSFAALEGHILKFQAEEGSFYGMPLEPGSIEELFKEGDLSVDIKPLLGRNTLQAVKSQEGYIELYVKLNLF